MIKVCILTQWMNTYGGLQKVVCNIANGLSTDTNIDLTICTLDKNRIYYQLNENIKVDYLYNLSYRNRNIIQKGFGYLINRGIVNIQSYNKIKSIYFPSKRIDELDKYLASNNYDVVIATGSELSILLSLSNCNCKKIGWQHNEYNAYFKTKGKYSFGLEEFAKIQYKKLDNNIVLTSYMAESFDRNLGIKSTVIHNPLNFTSDKVSDQQNNQLLFIGRLMKQNKGLDYLVDILNKLNRQEDKWNCVIVGDGPDRRYLENELGKDPISSKIKFVGQRDDVINYYRDSSILLNTSRWEGFGLTITEAMECGVVPVSFNHDGGKELITNNVNGLLIESFDTNDYTNKIINLINDRNRKLELSRNAKLKAKEFETPLIIQQWKKVISQ